MRNKSQVLRHELLAIPVQSVSHWPDTAAQDPVTPVDKRSFQHGGIILNRYDLLLQ